MATISARSTTGRLDPPRRYAIFRGKLFRFAPIILTTILSMWKDTNCAIVVADVQKRKVAFVHRNATLSAQSLRVKIGILDTGCAPDTGEMSRKKRAGG
jgi:hypothetical protein